MDFIIVYNYNPSNGYYTGSEEAFESPLEQGQGIYLMPPYCTNIEPPSVEVGYIQVWNGESWDIKDISMGGDSPVNPDPNTKTEAEKVKTRLTAIEDALLKLLDIGVI